jgi:myo-inositol 2-dehydrogenase / D-chiro-inositol 1-dehydrogenase
MEIKGEKPWTWADDMPAAAPGPCSVDGVRSNNLRLADTMKDRGFIESITSGRFHNQIADGVSTARSCMLGRLAAETGREMTWDGLEQNSEVYSLGMNITQFT